METKIEESDRAIPPASVDGKSVNRVLFMTLFIDLLGYGIVIPLLPDFSRHLGASPLVIGVLMASYSAMQFLFSPILGNLSDRLGRRPVLIATIAINGIAYALFGFVHGLGLLFASRMLAGIGGANLAVAQAYLSDVTPPAGRTKAFGMIGAALGLGFVFGPPVGGFIAGHFGNAAVGFTVAGLCAINLLLAIVNLPETRMATESPRVSASPRQSDFVPQRSWDTVLGSPSLVRLFLVYFLFITGFSVLLVVGPLLWIDRFSLTSSQVGYSFGVVGIVTAVIQGFIGKITARVGERRTLLFGLGVMSVALIAMPFIPATAFLQGEVGVIAAFAFGYALVLPTGTSLVAQASPGESQGKTLGLYQALGALGRIAGPFLGGAAYQMGQFLPFACGAALIALAMLVALGLHVSNKPPVNR